MRGGVPPLSLRALERRLNAALAQDVNARAQRSASAVYSRLWQLASLVLVRRIAHVRAAGG